MKNVYRLKRHMILLLVLSILLTLAQSYNFYNQRKAGIRDAMSAHIAAISDNVVYAVERLYSIQALVIGTGGQDVNLELIAPTLKKHEAFQYITRIAIAPDGIVTDIYPEGNNAAYLGMNLYGKDHPHAETSWQTVRTGKPAVTRPYISADNQQVVSIRLAIQLPDENGKLQNWGLVAISLAHPDVLQYVSKDVDLHYKNFDYRVYQQDNPSSERTFLFGNGDTDFVSPAQLSFYILDNRMVMEAIPRDGWVPPDSIAKMFVVNIILVAVVIVLVELIYRRWRRMQYDASLDPLTGILSRASGIREINRMLSAKDFEKGAFLMLDLDNFKNVNDTFGHERGDETLAKCAEQLKLLFRDSDLVCRLGGDEFVVFLPFRGDMVFLNKKIEHLLRSMRRDIVGNNAIVSISASVGIAISPDHGTTFEDLYHHADEALYRSKERGRDVATIYGEFVYQPGSHLSPEDFTFRSRDCILIIDDDFINREVLKNIFAKQYRLEEAVNGIEGLEKVREHKDYLSAILLDVNMPGMGGMELLEELHRQGIPYTVPVFLVTSHDDTEISRRAYELGVMDVIAKPVTPFIILRRVQSVIELYQARATLNNTVQDQAKSLQETLDTIDNLHRNTIEALASAIEFRDLESGEHINRIYAITKQILSCTAMGDGLSAEEIENIAVGSIMHDVGKISVSDVILNKPGKLTKEEFEIMKSHTTKGAVLMERLSQSQNHPAYEYAKDITRHHHERWDGKGYPDGLKGDEITVWSQVVSIADVYDALVSPRVYKKAFTADKAVEMIVGNECGVFNPKLVECFLQVEPDIRTWYEGDVMEDFPISEGNGAATPAAAMEAEMVDYLLLTAAVQSAYDMIISVNLTQNTFSMMDYDRFLTHCAENDGVFDELIAAGASSVPESHRQKFIDKFNRESLLAAYARGEKSVQLFHPQYADDGALMNVSTTVLFMEDPRNGDIRQITMAQYLPELPEE